MSAAALVMLVVALVVVWGGLGTAVVFLLRHPLPDDDVVHLLDEEPGGAPAR
ncbi:methionine/alanine import family NSS transporter small subunit [Georgenia thermotolerans]|uniref:Methionine/alanine import family NSS transporter small subunit n=1 Tax=Georgenia thermotolerans TaxID=527326 RepID=A0A7J5UPT1_9MICO|nr:methionine/alanine import family NSS transporter small subunit [Georgenia thermotolerans]KAE8764230.1 methionine/alanine import family NSS transporter small subunit [Georgenia thermotolerans]